MFEFFRVAQGRRTFGFLGKDQFIYSCADLLGWLELKKVKKLYNMLCAATSLLQYEDIEYLENWIAGSKQSAGEGTGPTKMVHKTAMFWQALRNTNKDQSLAQAWRQILDPYAVGCVTFNDFVLACKLLRYQSSDLRMTWMDLVKDKGDYMTFYHIDATLWRQLIIFRRSVLQNIKEGKFIKYWKFLAEREYYLKAKRIKSADPR